MHLFVIAIVAIFCAALLALTSYITDSLQLLAGFVSGVCATFGMIIMLFAHDTNKADAWWRKWKRFDSNHEAAGGYPDDCLAPISAKNTGIREGFTLIELLVVIAIITILVSLLIVGIWAVLGKGPEIRNRTELNNINLALAEFKNKHGIYPPSSIKLCTWYSEYDINNPNTIVANYERSQVAFLTTIWPNLDWRQELKWAGNNPLPPKTGVTLEGHQCLVFFLGGIPQGNKVAPSGFYKNPLNPTVATSTNEVIKYFEFDGKRCEILKGIHFPSYLDNHFVNHGKSIPFIYFSSNKASNRYTETDNISFGIKPYMKNSREYYNKDSCQLISAGANGILGVGQSLPALAGGTDDISNFWDSNLGVSP